MINCMKIVRPNLRHRKQLYLTTGWKMTHGGKEVLKMEGPVVH